MANCNLGEIFVTFGPMHSPAAAVVEARGLVKRFGDFVAVDGIDFAVTPGEALGFLGPNGAGKTSTMRMIGCVSPPSAGDLHMFGLDEGQPEIVGNAIKDVVTG